MATKLIIANNQPQAPQALSYYNGENIIKVDGQYFLIAQCDYGKMILFVLENEMEWNRKDNPVKIDEWSKLNTETIKNYIPEFSGKTVTRVNATITIQIND
jgi:hypothetical protein